MRISPSRRHVDNATVAQDPVESQSQEGIRAKAHRSINLADHPPPPRRSGIRQLLHIVKGRGQVDQDEQQGARESARRVLAGIRNAAVSAMQHLHPLTVASQPGTQPLAISVSEARVVVITTVIAAHPQRSTVPIGRSGVTATRISVNDRRRIIVALRREAEDRARHFGVIPRPINLLLEPWNTLFDRHYRQPNHIFTWLPESFDAIFMPRRIRYSRRIANMSVDEIREMAAQDLDTGRVETMEEIKAAAAWDAVARLKLDQLAENECVICREEYEEPISTLCGHVFCKDCVLPHLQMFGTCPICRREHRIQELTNIIKPVERGEDGQDGVKAEDQELREDEAYAEMEEPGQAGNDCKEETDAPT